MKVRATEKLLLGLENTIETWKKETCPLVKHLLQNHPQGAKFKFKINRQFHDALTRQSEESVRIQSSAQACMNSKAEFNAPPIPRIIVENS